MCKPRNSAKKENGDEDLTYEAIDNLNPLVDEEVEEDDDEEYEPGGSSESEDESEDDYDYDSDNDSIESDGDVKSEYGDEVENECVNAKTLYIGTMIDLANDDYYTLDLNGVKPFYPTQSKELGFIMYKDEVVSNDTLAQRLREIKGKHENVFYPRHFNHIGVGSWYYGRDSNDYVTKELKKYVKKIDYKCNNRDEYAYCLKDLLITSTLDVLFRDYTVKKTRRINYLYVDNVCVAVVCKRNKRERMGIIIGNEPAYILTSNGDILYTDIYKLDEELDEDYDFIGPVSFD